MKDDNPISNNSGNRPFEDVLKVNLARRRVLKGGVAAATTLAVIGPMGMAEAFVGRGRRGGELMGFTPVAVADGGGIDPNISVDYDFDIILPWGDPIEPGGPGFQIPVDPEAQTQQIGIGHDGMWFFPIRNPRRPRFGWDDGNDLNPWDDRRLGMGPGNFHGVLCLNHEFGTNNHVLRKPVPDNLDEVRASQHAHGVSVIEIKRSPGRFGRWRTVKGDLGRRIHANTPVTFSGPAAGHSLLATANGNVPLGTLNNCAYGVTPWGTYLTCEENFHGYFGTEDAAWTPDETETRYGMSSGGFGYFWHLFDKRFDLADPGYKNEANTYGWVVEIDPFDPNQTPVKRTALGRRKTEGAINFVAPDGRVVVYIGDDERWEYVYKFVSAEDWRTMRANGESPLDRGTLYAARFDDDATSGGTSGDNRGVGEWLPLTLDGPMKDGGVLGDVFADMGELLVNTRKAADMAGATPMDRPEWITVAPDGQVYCSLTNNRQRTGGTRTVNGREVDAGADEANPLTPNPDGHIIRWTETAGHTGTTFAWDIFVFSQDTHGTEESFSDPDGIWADPDGRLFIQTDGGQADGLNNQMLVANLDTKEIKRIFTGVPGCEITGVAPTPDRRTMFINVQHPGGGDASESNFPQQGGPDGVTVPRDATIVITRKDGGIIGS
ncbi:MAG: PhoX family phosphatase [Gammaproteobacteria bacterium]|nr:PhoX family phosphatase [Gammaproteobacteria bacterium]